jgi:hypothetical protein
VEFIHGSRVGEEAEAPCKSRCLSRQTLAVTVISAAPGYVRLWGHDDISEETFIYWREIIIAWRITQSEYPEPVTVEGNSSRGWSVILQPDGTACAQGDRLSNGSLAETTARPKARLAKPKVRQVRVPTY